MKEMLHVFATIEAPLLWPNAWKMTYYYRRVFQRVLFTKALVLHTAIKPQPLFTDIKKESSPQTLLARAGSLFARSFGLSPIHPIMPVLFYEEAVCYIEVYQLIRWAQKTGTLSPDVLCIDYALA